MRRSLEEAHIRLTNAMLLLRIKKEFTPGIDGTRGSNGNGHVIYFKKKPIEERGSFRIYF